jgi:WD40 repeat protein
MNRIRRLAPALVVLVVLVAGALAIGLVSRGQQGQQGVPLIDDGPNAGLSNDELVSVALANMKELKSYHFEFVGVEPAGEVTPTSRLTLSGYEQPPGESSRVSARGEHSLAGNTYSLIAILADETRQIPHEMITTGGSMYMSGDEGKTWQVFAPASGSYYVPPEVVLCTWGSPDSRDAARCESMIRMWKFKNGTPSTELIDNVPTRHLVVDALAAESRREEVGYGSQPMITDGEPLEASFHVWISTDATPMVRRLRFDVKYKETIGESSMRPFINIALSPNGRLLASTYLGTAGGDFTPGRGEFLEREPNSTVLVWDLTRPDNPPTRLIADETALIQTLQFSPDGKLLVATMLGGGEMRQGIYLWDTADLTAGPASIAGHSGPAWSPDGKMMATLKPDGVYLWNAPFVPDARSERIIQGSFMAIAFSPNDRTLAVAGEGGVATYNLADLKAAPTVFQKSSATSLAVSPDGALLVATLGSADGSTPSQVRLWDRRRPDKPIATFAGGGQLIFSPDGKLLGAGWQVWDVGQLVTSGPGAGPLREVQPQCMVRESAFSADLQKLAIACGESKVEVWDLSGSESAAEPVTFWRDPVDNENISNSLTWTWSRFNEEFEEVKPPPVETIKQPAP